MHNRKIVNLNQYPLTCYNVFLLINYYQCRTFGFKFSEILCSVRLLDTLIYHSTRPDLRSGPGSGRFLSYPVRSGPVRWGEEYQWHKMA